MNLTISGHHLDVSPALREYVLTKLDRVTRHFDQVVDITVLLSVEKLSEKERRQKAEVTLHVKGKDIFAECASEDLYAAIDQLMDKLDRQVVPPQGQGPGPPPRRLQARRRQPELTAQTSPRRRPGVAAHAAAPLLRSDSPTRRGDRRAGTTAGFIIHRFVTSDRAPCVRPSTRTP